MGASRLVIASIVLSLYVAGVWAEKAVIEDVTAHPKASDPASGQDTEKLSSQIAALESSVADGRREDDHISELDKIILEKSTTIATLKGQIESLQRKDALDVEESVRKEKARATNLEKQVENIRNDLESEWKNRDSLQVQAGETEKEVQELKLKVEKLEKANDEKNHIIRKDDQAKQAAKKELMKAQLEVTQKMNELQEVHGAWLPPWLATHISYYLDLAGTRWKLHAKPTFDASEKSAPVQKWLEPHRETAKTVPAVKKRWMILSTTAEPFVQKTFTAIVKVYAFSKTIILLLIVKARKVVGPYFQVVKKISKPYINQVASAAKLHVEKAKVAFKPLTPWVAPAYMKLIESTITYHRQIKAVVEVHLKKYEPTNSLAVKELAWFAASAILATIILIVYRLLSSIPCVKKKLPAKNVHQHRHTNNN